MDLLLFPPSPIIQQWFYNCHSPSLITSPAWFFCPIRGCVPRPPPHRCGLQESSSRGVWARFPWLGTSLASHICQRFADSVLIAQVKCQVSTFLWCFHSYPASTGHTWGHRFHRATQPFTAMITPQWTYSSTVSKG